MIVYGHIFVIAAVDIPNLVGNNDDLIDAIIKDGVVSNY